MCQSKSDGVLCCVSHINEGMNKNNAAFNALVVEEIEANGYKGVNCLVKRPNC